MAIRIRPFSKPLLTNIDNKILTLNDGKNVNKQVPLSNLSKTKLNATRKNSKITLRLRDICTKDNSPRKVRLSNKSRNDKVMQKNSLKKPSGCNTFI